jgi:peptide/nickel transport system substrate-binding protein
VPIEAENDREVRMPVETCLARQACASRLRGVGTNSSNPAGKTIVASTNSRHLVAAVLFATTVLAGPALAPRIALSEPRHAIALQGEPALPAGFSHFPYADPDAPKGGRLTLCVAPIGHFSTKSLAAPRRYYSAFRNPHAGSAFVYLMGELVFDSLLVPNLGEPFTLYGLIAREIETSLASDSIAFTLDPRARFSDGSSITVEDVIFSIELLRERGDNYYRVLFEKIESIDRIGTDRVRFGFNAQYYRELVTAIGLMPVLPRHATSPADFDTALPVPTIGSGSYTVVALEPDRTISYRRNPDYWAVDHPTKKGVDNFDEIDIEVYRRTALLEAFKSGRCDLRAEGSRLRWGKDYTFPAVEKGLVVRETFVTALPKKTAAFVFNTRREPFNIPGIRRALSKTFNIAAFNARVGLNPPVARASGYFDDSELSSVGRPADDWERELLTRFPGAIDDDVMAGSYRPVEFDRSVAHEILLAFKDVGFEIRGNDLVDRDTGERFAPEIVVPFLSPERSPLPDIESVLRRFGINPTFTNLTVSEYTERLEQSDYDMAYIETPDYGLSPNATLLFFYWSSRGSWKLAGASSSAVDNLIDTMLSSRLSREEYVSTVRALDRLLISGYYAMPLFYEPEQLVARWKRVVPPKRVSLYGVDLRTWWANDDE